MASSSKEDNGSRPKDSNFRSHYYDKVGFRGVNERKALDQLLSDDPVNVDKLSNFALKCLSVPASDRLLVWKLILGITSRYTGNRASGWQWKTRTFHDCLRSVKHLTLEEQSDCGQLTLLWLVTTRRKRPFGTFDGEAGKTFSSIAGYMLTVCNSSVEAFHVSKVLRNLLDVDGEVIEDHVAFYHKKMSSDPNTKGLHSHCQGIGLSSELPIGRWISRAFTDVFRTASLCKILDKVIAGSLKVLVYLAMTVVERKRKALMDCHDTFSAILCLRSVREESEATLVQYALERWARDGHQLLAHHSIPPNQP